MTTKTSASDKAGRPLGPTGETVRANIKRLRADVLRIPVTELSQRLSDLDRPIPPLGLRRIEDGSRRVDIDDLMSIAVALEVSPASLLLPLDSDSADDHIAITGVGDGLAAKRAWEWVRADNPMSGDGSVAEHMKFVGRAAPAWRVRQYVKGVQKILELNKVEREMNSPDAAVAAAAKARFEEIQKEYQRGND